MVTATQLHVPWVHNNKGKGKLLNFVPSNTFRVILITLKVVYFSFFKFFGFMKIFIWILIIKGIFLFCANAQEVTFNGSLWDNATGIDIKSTIYAISEGRKIKLGESSSTGIISLKIPTNIQYLIFESDGYTSIKQPVSFTGLFIKSSKFNIGIRTSIIGIPPPKMLTTGIFCIPNSNPKDIQYEIFRAEERFFITNITRLINANLTSNHEMSQGHYLLVISTKEGEKLMEKDVFIKEGLTFVDTHIEEQSSDKISQPTLTEKVFKNLSVYFDQSKYDLKNDAHLVLDSTVNYLINHIKTKILVVGYTDNIGNKEPNLTLSEYRARAVSAYLEKNGVHSTQIITKWKGSENNAGNKINNKRVDIQIIQ